MLLFVLYVLHIEIQFCIVSNKSRKQCGGPLEGSRIESRNLNLSGDNTDSIKIRETLSETDPFRSYDTDNNRVHTSKYHHQKSENTSTDESEGNIGNSSESQNDMHVNSPVDVYRNENSSGGNSSYNSFDSISARDIENCPSSTPIDISANLQSIYSADDSANNESRSTEKSDSFNETEDDTNSNETTTTENNSSFDPNILLDRLRLLTAEVKVHVNEMHHITKVLRRNNIIY